MSKILSKRWIEFSRSIFTEFHVSFHESFDLRYFCKIWITYSLILVGAAATMGAAGIGSFCIGKKMGKHGKKRHSSSSS